MKKEKPIIKLSGKNYYLDNFYPCEIKYKGITYKNSEAAFQAQKAPKNERETFSNLNGADAKRRGSKKGPYKMNEKEIEKWNAKSILIMEEVVRAKFKQHPELMEKLISTGNAHIVEGNNHGDNLYGIPLKRIEGTKKLFKDENGDYVLDKKETNKNNHLGKILMKIRNEAKK